MTDRKRTQELYVRQSTAGDAAQQASLILREMQARRQQLKTTSKGGTDFTTEADAKAEADILTRLKAAFPEDEFLAEESAPANYDGYVSKRNLWVIDPLDGTTNYSLGEENYAISIAFVDAGKPIFGIICQPARHLTVLSYLGGACKELDNQGAYEIRVSPETDPAKCTIGCNFYYTPEGKDRMLEQLWRIIPGNFRSFMARGSAVGDLLAVADGRAHAYVQENLKPWDVAAAGLMVQLAGGKVTGIDGTPWHPFRHDILASNGHIHELLLKLLNG